MPDDAVIGAPMLAGATPLRSGVALALLVVAGTAALAMPLSLLPYGLVLGGTLVALAAHDLAAFRLPDLLTLPLLLAGLAVSFVLPDRDPAAHAIGAMIGFGLPAAISLGYRLWRGRDGMGLGDAKLLAAGGAWLGWQAIPSVLLLAALAGIGWFAVLARSGRQVEAIPFGVPLAGATWIVWLAGPLAA